MLSGDLDSLRRRASAEHHIPPRRHLCYSFSPHSPTNYSTCAYAAVSGPTRNITAQYDHGIDDVGCPRLGIEGLHSKLVNRLILNSTIPEFHEENGISASPA